MHIITVARLTTRRTQHLASPRCRSCWIHWELEVTMAPTPSTWKETKKAADENFFFPFLFYFNVWTFFKAIRPNELGKFAPIYHKQNPIQTPIPKFYPNGRGGRRSERLAKLCCGVPAVHCLWVGRPRIRWLCLDSLAAWLSATGFLRCCLSVGDISEFCSTAPVLELISFHFLFCFCSFVRLWVVNLFDLFFMFYKLCL